MLNSAAGVMLMPLNIRALAIDRAESIYKAQGKLLYSFLPAISNFLHVFRKMLETGHSSNLIQSELANVSATLLSSEADLHAAFYWNIKQLKFIRI